MKELTKEEHRAIKSFKRLAKNWPESLWLFSANGTLNVMMKNCLGVCAFKGDRVDQEYSVATIDIESDGGDW